MLQPPQLRLRERATMTNRPISVFYYVDRGTWDQSQVQSNQQVFDTHPSAFGNYKFDYRIGGVTRIIQGIHPVHPVQMKRYSSYSLPGVKERNLQWGDKFKISGDLARLCPIYDGFNFNPTSPLFTGDLGNLNRGMPWDAERSYLAIEKAYRKVGQPDASLGLALVTFSQTVNLLRHAAEGFVSAIKKVQKMQKQRAPFPVFNRKGKFIAYAGRPGILVRASKAGKETLRNAASNWLEYSYGLLPSVQDFIDAQHIVQRTLEATALAQKSHAGNVETTNEVGLTQNSEFNNYSFMSFWRKTVTVRDSYTAGVQYTYVTQPSPLFKHGLDPMNIPAIIWDALPWSFVVDWSGNVSSWLNRVVQRDNIVYANDFISHKVDIYSRYDSCDTTHQGVSLGATSASFREEFHGLDRRYGPGPIVNPQFNVIKFGITRTCNALALASQVLKKLGRK